MYKIIGTDQKEYGPVSSDQIQQWITQGRVNAQTKAQSDGGEWKPLGDFPEFASFFGPAVPPMAPPVPGQISPAAQHAPTSGLAIASLVLGILGIFTCGLTALVGLILGIVSLSQVRKSNGALGGKPIALAGTIVSAVFLFILPFVAVAMFLPALSAAKSRAMSIQCMNNMRQISLAARLYAGDHDDHFPAANNWCDELKQYVGDNIRVYKCSAADSADRCDYAYNSQVAGLETKNVNPQTVLFFESNDGWNLSGGRELTPATPRHNNRRDRKPLINVAFADGHVEAVAMDRLSQLRWEP
jgi:prepilin-type processing-associated H-X9-DG protein